MSRDERKPESCVDCGVTLFGAERDTGVCDSCLARIAAEVHRMTLEALARHQAAEDGGLQS